MLPSSEIMEFNDCFTRVMYVQTIIQLHVSTALERDGELNYLRAKIAILDNTKEDKDVEGEDVEGEKKVKAVKKRARREHEATQAKREELRKRLLWEMQKIVLCRTEMDVLERNIQMLDVQLRRQGPEEAKKTVQSRDMMKQTFDKKLSEWWQCVNTREKTLKEFVEHHGSQVRS